MVLRTFRPACPCGESGLNASIGAMGLSWTRIKLSVLLWLAQGTCATSWERQKPCLSWLSWPQILHGGQGVLKGRKPSHCVTGKGVLDHQPPTPFALCLL